MVVRKPLIVAAHIKCATKEKRKAYDEKATVRKFKE